MTTYSPATLEKFRQAFKKLNVLVLWMWRLGLRKWMNICPPLIGRIMVLTHTGRKSGMKRRTPVNYSIIDGELYCMAGFGSISDWYRNLQKTPQLEVWLPNSWWAGVAEEAENNASRIPLLRQIIKDSGFAGFTFGLNAYKMSDEQIATATESYRLLHIQRTERLRGRGGPGDLAWVWLIPAGIALVYFLMRLPG
jgi:deazaflavin-dependent oxidoreductase (nitroreductase family)